MFDYSQFDKDMDSLFNSDRAREFSRWIGEEIAKAYIKARGTSTQEDHSAWRHANFWMDSNPLAFDATVEFLSRVVK